MHDIEADLTFIDQRGPDVVDRTDRIGHSQHAD